MLSHWVDCFVLLNLAEKIMVMAESPVEGNSGGQEQIERLRISHFLVVALRAVIKYPGKEHDLVLLC